MEIKSPWAIALVASAACIMFALWQVADHGLSYVRSQLYSDQHLIQQVGPIQTVVAYRARYMNEKREYWVCVTGSNGSLWKHVSVRYAAGIPQGVDVR